MFFVPEDMEGEDDEEEGIVSSVVPKKMPAMEYSEPPQLENDVEDEIEGASPLSGILEQQQQPTGGGQGIIKVDELADGSLVVEPSDDQELFDAFLGRVNDISEATGASDFESEVIPLLQREIPGLRVYEIEEDEEDGGDDEEPSLDDSTRSRKMKRMEETTKN